MRRLLRAGAVTLLLAVGLALAPTTHGAAAPGLAQSEPELPSGYRAVHQGEKDPRLEFSAALTEAATPLERTLALQLQTISLANPNLSSVGELLGVPQEAAVAIPVTVGRCVAHFRPATFFDLALGAGDLNGDGKADLLVVHNDAALYSRRAIRYEARSGVDGTLLWSTEGCETGLFGRLDVNLDGVADLVLFDMYSAFGAVDQRLRVIDPTDGTQLWELSTLGLGPPSVDVVSFIGFSDDAGGGPGPDIVLNTLSGEPGLCASVLAVPVYDGATGQVLARPARPSLCMTPSSIPIADVSGDGLADLAWATSIGTTSPDAQLEVTTSLGKVVWSKVIQAYYVDLSQYSLTGPLGTDLVLKTCDDRPSFGYCDASLRGVKGTNGAELWHHPDSGFRFQPAGDIDGDGGTDIQLFAGDFVGNRAIVSAFSGRTGVEIWNRSLPIDWVNGDAFVYLIGRPDFTGDGVTDVSFGVLDWDQVTGTERGPIYGADGATGADLWEVQYPDDNLLGSFGDVNGNGTNDVVHATYSYVYEYPNPDCPDCAEIAETAIEIDIYEGADHSPIWSTTIWEPHALFLRTATSGDFTGDAAAEIVVSISSYFYLPSLTNAVATDPSGRIWGLKQAPTELSITSAKSRGRLEVTTRLSQSPGGPGIGGRRVHVFANGVEVGTGTTNPDGIAKLTLAAKDKDAVLSAKFLGDLAYFASES